MAIICQDHKSQHYKLIFNQDTGFQLRSEYKGYPEPFWSEDGPELLDLSITSYCERECAFCYRSAGKNGKHMAFADVCNVIDQAKSVGVLQIALGGGNPNQHPQFIKILKNIRGNGIVPSYTSNGEEVTNDILQATKEYCGAMALSVYPPVEENFIKLVERIIDMGIKLNLHVILSKLTFDMLMRWLLKTPAWLKRINALIVLNYKPIVKSQNSLILDYGKIYAFYETAAKCKDITIGFDSCSVPGIVTYMNAPKVFVEPCEASRFSAFISEDMKMYPCSFMTGTNRYGDLREHSLLDIWRENESFRSFRKELEGKSCPDCKFADICMGGCHFIPTINQCGKSI